MAGTAKFSQLPLPARNPSTINARITSSLVAVSTFWILATRLTPRKFSRVKTRISPEPTTCAQPSFSEKLPDPMVNTAFFGFSAGKKYPRYPQKARAAAAIGAEKPAKKDIHPSTNPQVGP